MTDKALAKKPSAPASPKKTKPVNNIEHDVSGMGKLKHDVSEEGSTKSKAQTRKFVIDPFYMPGDKGEGAEDRYKQYAAAKQLRAVVGLGASGGARTEQWQSRDRPERLGDSWLQKVGWPADEKDKRWQAITGEKKPFPKVGDDDVNIDHIIELQLGGTNNPANLRPLDAKPNQRSGGAIWQEVSSLASTIRELFTLDDDEQIELRFKNVETSGPVWPASPVNAPWNALKVDAKAMKERVAPTDNATTKYITVAVGANEETFAVPATWTDKKSVDLIALPFNKGPVQVISSMEMLQFKYSSPETMHATAGLDLRNRTRIPLGAKGAPGAEKARFEFTGTKTAKGAYDLKLTKKPPTADFDYPFLSRVHMTDIALNPGGDLDWKATVTPSVRFLPTFKAEYARGEFRVIAGLDEGALKKMTLLGFAITKAQVSMLLAPNFDINGELEFIMGQPASPLVIGNLKLSKDDIGPVGTGHVSVKIPKVKEASSDITYKGGGDRKDAWTVALRIRSEDFTLPGGYSVTGQLDAGIDKGDLTFAGKLSATLPGGNSAELELERKRDKEWVLAGRGVFKVPKVNTVHASARYYLSSGKLIVGTKDVSFEIFGLKAKLNELEGVFEPDHAPVFTGEGEVALEKGKVSGSAKVKLNKNGKFTGKGSVTYRFNDKLSAMAGVELDEKERLKFSGKLVLTYLKLFDPFEDTKNLFEVDFSIPIPGASIGGVGLKAKVGGGVSAGYKIGPGSLGPITFAADFYPLEENSELTVDVDGMASIPATARLTAFIKGGIVLDALIAEVGGELILEGWIELKGGLFAKFSAKYTQGKIKADLTPEIKATLMLGIALKLHAWAKAGVGWLSVRTDKTWTLGKREVDTHLGFSLKAPIGYATDTGPKFPSIDQVDLKKPEITADNMSRIAKELVSGTTPVED